MLNTADRWMPQLPADQKAVLEELDAIIASYHFRGSKRYPTLLKYIVNKTLDGLSDELKERTIGVEVFHREPDYDTNADPVVRFSAGEIRKRIAQYYFENSEGTRPQIQLPLGSYVPEFKPRPEATPAAETVALSNEVPPLPSRRRDILLWTGIAAAALLLVACIYYAFPKKAQSTAADIFWQPLLQSHDPILIITGTDSKAVVKEPASTISTGHLPGPFHPISLADGIALSQVVGELKGRDEKYEVKEDADTKLADIRSRPLILIGAMNNWWTMRLIESLRFRFIPGPLAQVEDTKAPQNTSWKTDFTKPLSSISQDYAIVARYHDPTTNGNVLIIAGLGAYGTEAASELVTNSHYLEQVLRKVPTGWENKNLEIVLKTGVVNGEAGPPKYLASTVW